MGDKRCGGCGEVKSPGDFHQNASKGDGLSNTCKPCAIDGSRRHRLANRDRTRAYMRRYYIENKQRISRGNVAAQRRRQYGLSPKDYEALVARYGGRCAICRRTPEETGRSLHVDHDHKKGNVRGLLCFQCNAALGLLQDSTVRLESAIAYLRGGDG